MEYIEDLSWSNIVKLIQHEEVKGADFLNTCAHEMEVVRGVIAELERKTNQAKSREQALLNASYHVAKHLNKELPLAVQRQGYVVVLSKENLTIERNVI